MAKRIAVFDPSGRLLDELDVLADEVELELVPWNLKDPLDGFHAMFVAPSVAADLGPQPADGPPRWVVGEGTNAGKIAGAAAGCFAAGVLIAPTSVEALKSISHVEASSLEIELARSRGLIATSLVNLTGAAAETLMSLAEGFAANDCIVWWRDGNAMTPTAARPAPTEQYQKQIAGAARIAAAASGTVIVSGPKPRSLIAEALRSSPNEVAGLVAIISDSGRRFSPAERTDLKAIAARLTRELSWLTSHRRLVADGERLLASSLHDPLTGAMTRGAFEQTITHEVAAAGRRNEKLTLAVVDVAGLRKINLEHGHKVGDEVLAQLATRVRAAVRGNDPIGRLGSDEMSVLLVGAPQDQAEQVLGKLIAKIHEDPIRIDDETSIAVKLRGVLTELAPGERSGEAAFARIYSRLRGAPTGKVTVVPPDERPPEGSEQLDSNSLATGTILGGSYRIVHELSRGAMGVVYRGEDLGLNRPVAIKVLRSDLASDKDLVTRFRAEAAILASLHHPNLVQIYALGEHQGEVYFAMELVEGQPLSEVLRNTLERKEWFPTEAAAQITLEIGDALDAMHELGLIHRDVKPANILLDRERDRAVLVDVGVAVKAGDARDAAGTPGFAAPESFLEQADAPTTDVYGLASTVYCMLTGRPPFGSGPAPQVVQRQLNDALRPPSELRDTLSEAVDAVLTKALAPNAKKRWASASTFAIALGRALERLGSETQPPPSRFGIDPAKAAEMLMAPTSGIEPSMLPLIASQTLPAITGRVRAAHLRVLSKLMSHSLGETIMARIITGEPSLARVLAPTLPPLEWVDLSDLLGAFAHANAQLPNAMLARKVGRGTMSATFARLFGAEPTTLATEKVLAALPTFWARYHDWCKAHVQVSVGGADVTLHGYPASQEVCTMVAAELERIVELTGASAVGCAQTQCVMNGAAACTYRLSWTR